MSEEFRACFAYNEVVMGHELMDDTGGLDPYAENYPRSNVMPMGWISAPGIMQYLHRKARLPKGTLWHTIESPKWPKDDPSAMPVRPQFPRLTGTPLDTLLG